MKEDFKELKKYPFKNVEKYEKTLNKIEDILTKYQNKTSEDQLESIEEDLRTLLNKCDDAIELHIIGKYLQKQNCEFSKWFFDKSIQKGYEIKNMRNENRIVSTMNIPRDIAEDLLPQIEKQKTENGKYTVEDLEKFMQQKGADLELVDAVISELVEMEFEFDIEHDEYIEDLNENRENDIRLGLVFSDKNEFYRAQELFNNGESVYFSDDSNSEFNTLYFNVEDQNEADTLEQELEIYLYENEFVGYYFEIEDPLNEGISKDRVKEIRQQLKQEFPQITFSVTRRDSNLITVAILKAPINFLKGRERESRGYEQVNNYYIKDNYSDNPEARDVLLRINDIVSRDQREITYDGDYGSVPNYYVHIEIGKWDRPFIYTGEQTNEDKYNDFEDVKEFVNNILTSNQKITPNIIEVVSNVLGRDAVYSNVAKSLKDECLNNPTIETLHKIYDIYFKFEHDKNINEQIHIDTKYVDKAFSEFNNRFNTNLSLNDFDFYSDYPEHKSSYYYLKPEHSELAKQIILDLGREYNNENNFIGFNNIELHIYPRMVIFSTVLLHNNGKRQQAFFTYDIYLDKIDESNVNEGFQNRIYINDVGDELVNKIKNYYFAQLWKGGSHPTYTDNDIAQMIGNMVFDINTKEFEIDNEPTEELAALVNLSPQDFVNKLQPILFKNSNLFEYSESKINENLRSVKVIYSGGKEITTSMAAHLTDEEIYDYFAIGKTFNLGSVEDDLQQVEEVIILETHTQQMPYRDEHVAWKLYDMPKPETEELPYTAIKNLIYSDPFMIYAYETILTGNFYEDMTEMYNKYIKNDEDKLKQLKIYESYIDNQNKLTVESDKIGKIIIESLTSLNVELNNKIYNSIYESLNIIKQIRNDYKTNYHLLTSDVRLAIKENFNKQPVHLINEFKLNQINLNSLTHSNLYNLNKSVLESFKNVLEQTIPLYDKLDETVASYLSIISANIILY